MENFISTLLIMSAKSSVLIIIVVFAKKWLNDLFSANQHFNLWIFIVVILLFPIRIESNYSIYSIREMISERFVVQETSPNLSQNIDLNNFGYEESLKVENIVKTSSEGSFLTDYDHNIRTDWNLKALIRKYSQHVSRILFFMWLSGFLFLLVVVIVKEVMMHNKIKLLSIKVSRTNKLLDKCKSRLGITSRITIVECDLVSTPSLIGILNLKVLIPKEILSSIDDEKLEYILLHELAHIKRKDNIMIRFMLFTRLVYWFNPIVWYGLYKMKQDMEVACDAYVLSRLEKKEYIDYGKVIINLLEHLSGEYKVSPVLKFAGDKNEVIRRIMMIKKFNKNTRLISIIGVLMLMLIGCSVVIVPPTFDESEESDNSEVIITEKKQVSSEEADFKLYENLLGMNQNDLYMELGSMRVAVYYVDPEDLDSNEQGNRTYIAKEYAYLLDDGRVLYAFFNNDVVEEIRFETYNGVINSSKLDIQYQVNIYDYEEGDDIDETELFGSDIDFELLNLKNSFLGENIDKLKTEYSLKRGFTVINNTDNNQQLRIYPIASKENISASKMGLYVLVDDKKIIDLKIDKSDVEFDRLNEHFKVN